MTVDGRPMEESPVAIPAAGTHAVTATAGGAVVLVVRNDQGGVTWRFGALPAE